MPLCLIYKRTGQRVNEMPISATRMLREKVNVDSTPVGGAILCFMRSDKPNLGSPSIGIAISITC